MAWANVDQASRVAVSSTAILLTGYILISHFPSVSKRGPSSQGRPHRGNIIELSRSRGSKDGEVQKVSEIPDGWWTSESQFETEKRAIFAKVCTER